MAVLVGKVCHLQLHLDLFCWFSFFTIMLSDSWKEILQNNLFLCWVRVGCKVEEWLSLHGLLFYGAICFSNIGPGWLQGSGRQSLIVT